jgi:hypothetical protein
MKDKYAKLPKKYRVNSKNPVVWRIVGERYYSDWILGRFRYHLWILRPICWIKGHHNRVLYPYGCKIKQCQRCAKVFYKKQTKEPLHLYSGEVGNLYGVRFITTNEKPIKNI